MNTTEKSRRPSFDQGVIELPADQTRAFFRAPASEFKRNFSLLRTKKKILCSKLKQMLMMKNSLMGIKPDEPGGSARRFL